MFEEREKSHKCYIALGDGPEASVSKAVFAFADDLDRFPGAN